MSYSEDILEVLFSNRRWMSTLEVSKKAKISWETAESYLSDLESDEYVLHKKTGKKDLWKFNYIKWKKMQK